MQQAMKRARKKEGEMEDDDEVRDFSGKRVRFADNRLEEEPTYPLIDIPDDQVCKSKESTDYTPALN